MPTLNKLEYLDETKQQIKNALNTKFNSQITDNDTFRSYVDKIKNIYNTWSKVTGEGTNISLNNTKKGLLQLVPKGDTKQTTYTGKNLWSNINLATTTANGITFTPVYENGELKYINANGTATANSFYNLYKETIPAGTYKLSGCNGGDENTYMLGINFTNSSLYRTYQTDEEVTFTLSEETTLYESFIRIINGQTVNNVKFYPMISIIGGNYEPYVGKTASPNPDYSQEIQSVTGNQEIKVTGKNLINQDTFTLVKGTNRTKNIYFPTAIQAGTYTLSLNATNVSELTSNYSLGIQVFSANTKVLDIGNIYQNGVYTKTFTISEQIDRLYMYINSNPNLSDTATITINNLMVEKGSTATTYKAYSSNTYEVNLGNIELNKISTYEDRIYKNNGKWYLEKKIGKVVLDGSETYETTGTNTSGKYKIRYDGVVNLIKRPANANIIGDIISNQFISLSASDTYRCNQGISVEITGKISFYDETLTQSTSAFKTWLESNNMTIYYGLNTPTYTEITNTELIEDLDNLASAMSYDGTTNISSSGDLPMILSVSALMKGSE